MIIKDFKYFPFSLQLKIPFQSSTQIITQKNGFIISLIDELGNQSFGEASPLSGFSRETNNDLIQNLSEIKSRFDNLFLLDVLSTINDQLSTFELLPSVRFSLEQAILSLMIKKNRNFVNQFVGILKSVINVNAVFGFDDNRNIISAIDRKIEAGFNTIKIKVGRDDFENDFELIKEVREKFGRKINIRLDVNGIWELGKAKKYLERLSLFNIQYIEEPCSNLNDLIKLAEVSQIPIAIDESLESLDFALEIINNSKIEIIIMKPMVLGGLFSSFRIIKEAEKKNKKVIISSSFESAIGKSGLVLLAATTNHNFAHGLDTSEFFEKDICFDPFTVKDGKIYLASDNYPPQFNLNFI